MNPTEIVDVYCEAWNTADDARRRTLLEACWGDTASYTDPTAEVDGRDALHAHIGAFLAGAPGSIVRTSGVDEHHGRIRFTWAMRDGAGSTIVEGVDFARLGKDGRLGGVTGFFGPPPA